MALIIKQQPLKTLTAAVSDIIFSVKDAQVVGGTPTVYYNIKYGAEVHISTTTPPNTAVSDDVVGTFKVTPNNAGAGIFNLREIVQSFVKSDNLAADNAEFKTTIVSPTSLQIPIHLINKGSRNTNSIVYLIIQFFVEGSITTNGIPSEIGSRRNSRDFTIVNGYIKHDDKLRIVNNDFGFNTDVFIPTNSTKRFLTNAPTTLYAKEEDYGTVAFYRNNNDINKIRFDFYDSSGSSLGNEDISFTPGTATGNGVFGYNSEANRQMIFFGIYPANLRNWSTTFQTIVTNQTLSYYTVKGTNAAGSTDLTETITINKLCPNLKGFESIRICWLNQWGGWDYYTFTQKSVKSINTSSTTFNQLEGTWNAEAYRLNSFRGGQRTFRVNAKEQITMNTDFISEADSVWFEDLINSPEIYVLKGFETDETNALLNTYVEPVRLLTNTYQRKTIANDKLIQYTFQIEKSKLIRTQAV